MARCLKLIFTCGLLFALGCDRPTGKSTKITIQAPAAHGKVGALAALPANRKACYGVNLIEPEVTGTPATQCNPRMGIVAGFKESGEQISVSVNKGSGRTLELYLFLEDTGANDPCPPMGQVLTPAQLLNTYLIGTVSNLTIEGTEQIVEITAVFPGVANYLAQTMAMPATCTVAANPIGPNPKFSVSSGMQMAVGTGVKLKARLGAAAPAQTLTGSGHKLIIK